MRDAYLPLETCPKLQWLVFEIFFMVIPADVLPQLGSPLAPPRTHGHAIPLIPNLHRYSPGHLHFPPSQQQ